MNIIVDNLAVRYVDMGHEHAPVVLFLHGWGVEATTFQNLITELIGGYRLIALDLPGFGQSERPHTAWGVGDYARFVQGFLLKIKVAPNFIVGHSFGGRIAIKMVSQNLASPRKLVLISSAGINLPTTLKRKVLKVVLKAGKALTAVPPLRPVRSTLQRLTASQDYLTAGPLRETFLKIIREDLRQDATRIAIPTLLIWGEKDTTTPPKEGEILHQHITGSQLVIIPGTGHFPYREAQAEVLRLLKSFFV